MPSYEEIIKQSQANVKSLSEKLKDLDKLHQDIISLKTKSEGIPLAFEQNFQKISELSKHYTETLGVASKTYLDGSNTLFTAKLNDLADKNSKLEKEISRLVNTDLTKLFNDLQKVFIEQTKKDVEIELKKIGEKTTDFQSKINSFGGEITRLEKVDLEKHFDKLQKTLSDIFGAINAINLTLTGLTSSLNSVIQTLGQIQKVIDDNFKETTKLITTFSKETNNHLSQQDKKNDTEFETLKKEVSNLSEQNSDLKKEIKTNRIIQIIGLVITISILIYIIIKQ
jgi:predicted  nucleic acid-binding Zn-ribbon protein